MESKEKSVVLAFIDAINHSDTAGMLKLMADDYLFIDSMGVVSSDPASHIEGWGVYFRMFPDYRITVDCIISEKSLVAVFGSAAGTYNGKRGLVPDNLVKMPAAWKAVVENNKIKVWQVYADWTEGTKIIEEDKKSA